MERRSAILLEFLAERHPSVNLQPWSLFKNRSGVRSLEQAESRIPGGRLDAYGLTDDQWAWLGHVPTWFLPSFLREGDMDLLVPAGHLADFWFHKLDHNAVSSARKIVLDILGEARTLEPFLKGLQAKLSHSYGDEKTREFLAICPKDGDQRGFASMAAQHGVKVGLLVSQGMPLEYAQAVAATQ